MYKHTNKSKNRFNKKKIKTTTQKRNVRKKSKQIIKHKKSIKYLVPTVVEEMILQMGFYK